MSRTDNVTTTYRYDAEGRRVYKSTAGGATYYYIHDIQGRTIAVLNGDGSIKMLNIHGLDHLGYIRVTYGPPQDEDQPEGGDAEGAGGEASGPGEVRTDTRLYYLKDHLGSIKVTVNEAGNVVSYDDY